MRILKKLFWPVFTALVAVALTLVLWSGREEQMSYRKMACSFEELPLGCVDANAEWQTGLAFFDSAVTASKDTLQSLKNLLWEYWDIEFVGADSAASSREVILPLQVLKTKKSGCMGLAWLALMVAEARNLPLNAILLPGHVFLRYGKKDDGRGQFGVKPKTENLEPNRRGYGYTDEEYREKYKNGPWTGLEFKPLSAKQFVGLAAFDMGNLYLTGEPRRALTWYRMAEELFPVYPGIEANQNVAKSLLPQSL
ncbi:MAG: transglutaminase-like domain-containing protein [Fibrobacter sp.]|nr:transglutaminase-like domain-containing protein [Fibrobacter sp.]